VEKRRYFASPAFPTAHGYKSNPENIGKLTLGISVGRSPLFQLFGLHGTIIPMDYR
jgi:hypothetical protein